MKLIHLKTELPVIMRRLYIKAFSWEYWPVWVIYFPVSFYYLYLSVKARSLFFFSAANPAIETGGMFFESKWDIFKLMPKEYCPATIFAGAEENIDTTLSKMYEAAISFPVITKPDLGERGWCVKKIENAAALKDYKTSMNVSFLVQSYIDYPVEMGIFYYRHPAHKHGIVTSVTLKKLLAVTGDGHSTIGELIKQDNRSFLQYNKLLRQNKIDFTYMPHTGEQVMLVPYGNHILGALFLNYNHIIDDALNSIIDEISQKIDGFYYGRYDLCCSSIEDLKAGKNFFILEVNGTRAEPAHIYEPGFSFFKAQLTIAGHFRMMYEAARENNSNGVAYMSFKNFRDKYKLRKQYRSKATIT